MNNDYDLIIIGNGSAGFNAAMKANELKRKTLLINTGFFIGGTCLHVGCVPSKRLLYIGELLRLTQNNSFLGLEFNVKKIDFPQIIKETQDLIDDWSHRDKEIFDSLEYVTYQEGTASFISSHQIQCNEKQFSADYILIATGSTAIIPPIENIQALDAITHVEAFSLKTFPTSLIIIGGGSVGLECAQIFSRLGSKVTILESAETPFALIDRELTQRLMNIFDQEGIKVHTNSFVKRAERIGDSKALYYIQNGKEHMIEAQEVLIATGKRGNTQQLNLEKIQVKTNKTGALLVNKYLQTNQPHIFGAGDVIAAPVRIATTAAQEGRIAVENAFLDAQKNIDYQNVPFALFTDPQFAFVGLQEKDIVDQKNEYEVFTFSFEDLAKATIIKRTQGLMKMIIHKQTKEIRGAHILSPEAAEYINYAMGLIINKNTITDILNTLPTYPTFAQSIKILASLN